MAGKKKSLQKFVYDWKYMFRIKYNLLYCYEEKVMIK